MIRSTNGKGNRHRMVALAASTALATLALGGCTTKAAPPANLSAGKAQSALVKGQAEPAVVHAEAAVLADPRNASYRAMLGAAYLEAGRFASAVVSFDDAMTLGDQSPRTALSLALAEIGAGNNGAALALLDDWRDDIGAADLGLALALAGDPDRGVHVLANALRGGENTAKVRQNLAYAYSLQGNWRAARLMAAEDVPADQIDERLGEWAQMGNSYDYRRRVAALLGAPLVADPGQPVELALANHPSAEQLAAEAVADAAPQVAEAPAAVQPIELPALEAQPAPPLAQTEPDTVRPASFEQAFAAPAPAGATAAQMVDSAVRFVSNPVVQIVPARQAEAPEQTPRPAAGRVTGRVAGTVAARAIAAPQPTVAPSASGDHLIQLGSFSSEASARRAWDIYLKRHPQLSRFDMVITKAQVRGKTYWRVSAGGFERAAASAMCSTVKAAGEGCIAWAEGKPLPGAVDTGVRMASR